MDKQSVRTYPVCMANLTLSIPEDLLKRGRRYARSRGTSLNALIRKLLSETVSSPDLSIDSMIERLKNGAGDSGGKKISREELHRY